MKVVEGGMFVEVACAGCGVKALLPRKNYNDIVYHFKKLADDPDSFKEEELILTCALCRDAMPNVEEFDKDGVKVQVEVDR